MCEHDSQSQIINHTLEVLNESIRPDISSGTDLPAWEVVGRLIAKP